MPSSAVSKYLKQLYENIDQFRRARNTARHLASSGDAFICKTSLSEGSLEALGNNGVDDSVDLLYSLDTRAHEIKGRGLPIAQLACHLRCGNLKILGGSFDSRAASGESTSPGKQETAPLSWTTHSTRRKQEWR